MFVGRLYRCRTTFNNCYEIRTDVKCNILHIGNRKSNIYGLSYFHLLWFESRLTFCEISAIPDWLILYMEGNYTSNSESRYHFLDCMEYHDVLSLNNIPCSVHEISFCEDIAAWQGFLWSEVFFPWINLLTIIIINVKKIAHF